MERHLDLCLLASSTELKSPENVKKEEQTEKQLIVSDSLFIPTEESPPAGHEEECRSDWPKQKKPVAVKVTKLLPGNARCAAAEQETNPE